MKDLEKARATSEAVAEVRETEDVHRVYVYEWIAMFSARSKEKCLARFEERYRDRVREDDWRIAVVADDYYELQLRLPNVVAEWKTAKLAYDYVGEKGWGNAEATVVARNSKADHDLRKYGMVKIA